MNLIGQERLLVSLRITSWHMMNEKQVVQIEGGQMQRLIIWDYT